MSSKIFEKLKFFELVWPKALECATIREESLRVVQTPKLRTIKDDDLLLPSTIDDCVCWPSLREWRVRKESAKTRENLMKSNLISQGIFCAKWNLITTCWLTSNFSQTCSNLNGLFFGRKDPKAQIFQYFNGKY